MLPPVWNALSLHSHPSPFLLRLSPDLILILVWEAIPHLFRFELDVSLCFFPCLSSLTPVQDSVVVGFLGARSSCGLRGFWMKSLTSSFISASLASSTVSAVSKWLDTAPYQLCKLTLAHMLALNENQVAGIKKFRKYRLFPPCTRFPWKFVFAGCFEYVISQTGAHNPLRSYFSGNRLSQKYPVTGEGDKDWGE